MQKLAFFAPCPAGIEPLLADELRRLRLKGVRPQRSGVLFAGSSADGMRALFWSRLASRVLLTLGEVDASSADGFYAGVHGIAWEEHVRATGTIAVDASGTNDALRNTQFTAVRTKDAVADRFREKFGRRPDVDVSNPDLRINVAVRSERATVSVDLSGIPLHRRGYRKPGVQVAAPMKETLAAAVLETAAWRHIAEAGGAFVDPMCGSGTLAIEAALIAADIAPGLLREHHPVQKWLGFDPAEWQRMVRSAEERRREGLGVLPTISASDVDPRAVEIARGCLRRAGLERRVTVECLDLAKLKPSTVGQGLIATNPPWGERLSQEELLPALYASLAGRLDGFCGWRLVVASPDPRLSAGLGLSPDSVCTIGTGKGAATATVFSLGGTAGKAAPLRTSRPGNAPAREHAGTLDRAGASPHSGTAAPSTTAPGTATPHGAAPSTTVLDATEFSNRLRKMAKHYSKWARRSGVGCYRVYDADLPDFAVAVDLLEGAGDDSKKRFAHVAEYAPPRHIDAGKAAARASAALEVVAEALDIRPEDVFFKRRQRQKGSSQYEAQARRSRKATVAENGLLFELNLSDYLDYGLFLDHRDVRAWIRDNAQDARFLNLFGYTGSASVYAAAGGARSTTTVDLSATYLEWGRRNFALNGLDASSGYNAPSGHGNAPSSHGGQQHRLVQADALDWVKEAVESLQMQENAQGGIYELIFCDAPTFSNSKRMRMTWDVQRDHAELLTDVGQLLAPKGVLVFSCNRRGFKLDEESLRQAGLLAVDVTARTIPKDFERMPMVHQCFEIRHISP